MIKMTDIKIFLIGLVISSGLLWPLFVAPYFSHHDDVQAIRLFEMDKCFQDLQIPCRWVPDVGDGYGYPLFNYYGPAPYYYGELIYSLTHSITFSVKTMFGTAFLLSYVFMFLLGRKIWGGWGGLYSGLFYTLAPYHSLVFYVRGAMAEDWGLVWMPAILWALLRLREKTNTANLSLVSLFMALLIASHNLTVLMFAPFLLLFILINYNSRKFIIYAFIAIILSVMLSGFYSLPMFLEKSLTHVESTTYGYFSYTEHFKGLKKLFLDFSWGWGDSVREVPGGPKDGLSFQIGIIHWLIFALCLILSFKKAFLQKEKKIGDETFDKKIIFICLGIFLMSVILIHPRSTYIWASIPNLKYIQFPWRFLGQIILALSIVAGSFPLLVKSNKFSKIIIPGILILLIAANVSYFRPKEFLNLTDQNILSGERWLAQTHRSILDYLPIFAKEPPPRYKPSDYQVLTGDMSISDYKQGTNWIKFNAHVSTHSILRISQYYFPEWKILDNNKPIVFDYENTLGLMTIILGEGDHQISLKLHDTPIRTFGNTLTVSTIAVLLFILLSQNKSIKRRLSYYMKELSK